MPRSRLQRIGWLVTWLALAAPATAQERSPVDVLRVGHWLELTGEFTGKGRFEVIRAEFIQPDRYETLQGMIARPLDGDSFELLGLDVEVSGKTDVRGLDIDEPSGHRVKVQGYYEGAGDFSSRKIYSRPQAGRDQIAGRVDAIRDRGDELEVQIMGFRARVAKDRKIRHELALEDYPIGPPRVQTIVDRQRDEDDRFGKGVWLTDRLFAAGLLQLLGERRDDHNLDDRRPRREDELEARFRGRLIYQPTDKLFALAELVYLQRQIDERDHPRVSEDITRVGEAYLYLLEPFNNDLSLQFGRVNFDEPREWLYDQNLDTARLLWDNQRLRAEFSYAETLFDGSDRAESAQTYIAYLSNSDLDRHVAGYVIHRRFEVPLEERRTHYGFRVNGEWFEDHESWLEIAWMDAQVGAVDNRAWAIDVGTTWEFSRRFSATVGYAIGQGDDRDTAEDETFRQTGLQDNNGKFAGVTSFRYYGELLDPELANLEVLTIGLGWRPRRRVSLDLVAHRYEQNELSRRLVDTELKMRPNGLSPKLGTEIDLILGWRTNRRWDLEVIAARFDPGDAFDNGDAALFGEVQFRYRF